MIVVTIAEFAQSYIAQARSSGRPRPSLSSQRSSGPGRSRKSRLIPVVLGMACLPWATIVGSRDDGSGSDVVFRPPHFGQQIKPSDAHSTSRDLWAGGAVGSGGLSRSRPRSHWVWGLRASVQDS